MSKTPAFTSQEIAILLDKNFLLTKRVALEKMMTVLGDLAQELQQTDIHQSFSFPQDADTHLGKISKGENYKGLPYMVLDFPKLFRKIDIFTFRSMFWWGKHFSFTLHLGGVYALQYGKNMLNNLSQLQQEEVYFCCNDTPWEYHFEETNYLPIRQLNQQTIEAHLSNTGFIKISCKLPIEDWQKVMPFGKKCYQLFLTSLE